MISAPSSSACWVPCCAPCGLPPSSLIRSWMLGFWNSASAISAAFFIDCAATPALPAADSGRINPTLTCPLPTASGCCAGPAGRRAKSELNGLENELRLCCTPAQAPSKGAPRIRPIAVRRVESGCDQTWDFAGPPSCLYLLTDRNRPGLSASKRSGGWIQAYCRRIVNQNKRIMALRHDRPVAGSGRTMVWHGMSRHGNCGVNGIPSSICLNMISGQTPRDCPEQNRFTPDHALDWHYARKSGFPQIRLKRPARFSDRTFSIAGHTLTAPKAVSGSSSGRDPDRQSRRHHPARAGDAGRRRHHRLRGYPHHPPADRALRDHRRC